MRGIIEKIQKLLALAERGGTEAEAEAAMMRVHELLSKYNLSMADVQSAKESELERRVSELQKSKPWERLVLTWIARLYYCEFLFGQPVKGQRRYSFIGKPVNIETAKYVGESVIRIGKKVAKDYADQRNKIYRESKVTITHSFLTGFSWRISVRCSDLIKAAKEGQISDSETGTALVLAGLYDATKNQIDNYISDEMKGKVRQNRKSKQSARDRKAIEAGIVAADDVSLKADGIENKGEAA